MKLYNLSGGSTKIGGLFAKSERIIKEFGYKPDIISGVSSGALLSLPIALGKWDELKKLVINFKSSDIFDVSPLNQKNKITLRGLWRTLIGKPSLGTQNNLRNTLSKLITEEDFTKYINGKYPKIYIGVVNINSGEFELIDIKTLKYNEYLDYTLASTSIPVAVEAQEINNQFYFDGGILNHICSNKIIQKYKNKITHNITVFSRPRNIDFSYANFDQIDMSQVIKAVYELNLGYISIKDQELEKTLCEQYKIKVKQVFCPSVLKSIYDMDHERLIELYNRSYATEDKKYYLDFI